MLSQDIGTVTVLTAGCYVFASVPSSYLPQQKSTDLTSKVISGIVNKNVTALAALPFVLDGLKAACESSTPEAQVLLGALRNMTMLECGGAVLDLSVADWAEQNDVPVVVGVGMTETGGAIFAGRAKETFSGFSPQGLIPDAQFSLIGGDNSDGMDFFYSCISMVLILFRGRTCSQKQIASARIYWLRRRIFLCR